MPTLLFHHRNLKMFLFCLIVIAGCKKTGQSPALYNFSYAGSLYANQAIHFTSNVTPGSGFIWIFGDGTTTGEVNPVHIYSVAGTYTVTLAIGVNDSVTKTIKIGIDSMSTLKLTGSRTWHHSYHFRHHPTDDTTYYYSDTSFSVSHIHPVTVTIGTDTLLYASSNDTLIIFRHTFYYDGVHETGDVNTLYFYTHTNKLRYAVFDHLSAGASAEHVYWTP